MTDPQPPAAADHDEHLPAAGDRPVPGRKKQVVILGGGFGGSYCARTLEKRLRHAGDDVDILLIDRNNYFIFYPLLVEAGIGGLQPKHAVVSIRQFAGRRVRFAMGEVKRVDFQSRTVTYEVVGEDDPDEWCTAEYDHLVVALGTVTLQPPIPGLREFGYEMKTMVQAIALRDRVVQLLEQASAIDDQAKRRALLHMVVVGGGYTGIETAGEYQHYMKTAAKRYPRLSPDDVKMTVIDRSDRIMKVLDESLSKWSTDHLVERGIDLRLRAEVAEIHEDHQILKDGTRLDSYTLVWAAGIAPNPLLKTLIKDGEIECDHHGYMVCHPDGRVKGPPDVWGVGDSAVNYDRHGNPNPATAQAALREGVAVGKNVAHVLRGEPTEKLDFVDLGQIAAFGRFDAVAQLLGKFKFKGFIAWFLFRSTYLAKMPGFFRKVSVAVDWTMDLVSRRDYVQFGVHRVVRAAPDAADEQQDPAPREGSGSADAESHAAARGQDDAVGHRNSGGSGSNGDGHAPAETVSYTVAGH